MPINAAIPLSAIGRPQPAPDLLGAARDVFAIRQQQAQMEQLQREQQREQQIQALASQYGNDPETFIEQVSRIDPMAGQTFAKRLAEAQREAASAKIEQTKLNRTLLQTGLSLMQGVTPEDYPIRRQVAIRLGGETAAMLLPEAFDEARVTGALSTLQSTDAYLKEQQEAMKRVLDGDVQGGLAWLYGHSTTPEQWQATTELAKAGGASRLAAVFGEFSPENQARALQIAGSAGPGQKEPHSDYGRFETDFLKAEAEKRGKAVDQLSPAERVAIKTQARKQFGQADDAARRPLAPIVIQTGAGPQLLNRETGQARAVTDQSGQVIGPAPTAEMRNKAAATEKAYQGVIAIRNLSDRIITKVGPAQRAEAIARGAAAVFGNDPEFRAYQDARKSLAGNLAVMQQGSRPSDADIMAIWLPLVPDAYRDTKESADVKWRLIETMAGFRPAEGGAPGATAGAGVERWERGPDGKPRRVQ